MNDPFYVKTITIWNKYTDDGVFGAEHWIPTVIENVRLLVSHGNNIQSSGNSAADNARLHISDELSAPTKAYMPVSDWIKLDASEKSKYFTLDSENDSFFVEGDTSIVDSTSQDNFFEYMKRNYSNCFRISSVDRFEVIPHFEVWGK